MELRAGQVPPPPSARGTRPLPAEGQRVRLGRRGGSPAGTRRGVREASLGLRVLRDYLQARRRRRKALERLPKISRAVSERLRRGVSAATEFGAAPQRVSLGAGRVPDEGLRLQRGRPAQRPSLSHEGQRAPASNGHDPAESHTHR